MSASPKFWRGASVFFHFISNSAFFSQIKVYNKKRCSVLSHKQPSNKKMGPKELKQILFRDKSAYKTLAVEVGRA
jgi:hypothetical protein